MRQQEDAMSEAHIVRITVTGDSSTPAGPAAALAEARAALQVPGQRMVTGLRDALAATADRRHRASSRGAVRVLISYPPNPSEAL